MPAGTKRWRRPSRTLRPTRRTSTSASSGSPTGIRRPTTRRSSTPSWRADEQRDVVRTPPRRAAAGAARRALLDLPLHRPRAPAHGDVRLLPDVRVLVLLADRVERIHRRQGIRGSGELSRADAGPPVLGLLRPLDGLRA